MHRTVAAACIVALLCVITPSRVGGVVLAPTTHTGTTVTDHLPAREDPFPPPSFKPTAALPPLLVFNNGSAVTTLEEWQQTRREQVQRLIATVFAGTVPSTTPKVLSATVVNRTHHGQALSTFYLIKYDTPPPAPPASMYIELLTPTSGWGDGPWPLVLTQWNHRLWALRGVTRGYAAVVYPGACAMRCGVVTRLSVCACVCVVTVCAHTCHAGAVQLRTHETPRRSSLPHTPMPPGR